MASRKKHAERSRYSYGCYKAYDIFGQNAYKKGRNEKHCGAENRIGFIERVKQTFSRTADKKGE